MGENFNSIKMKIFAPLLAGAALGKICDKWTMEVIANFDVGHTENIGAAMYEENGVKATKVTGQIYFMSNECGKTVISGQVSGLADGLHGWHIHNGGDVSSCGKTTTGGHFNPFGATLGAEDETRNKHREVGQIGNINCSGGECIVDDDDHMIRLYGRRGILGRSLVIHAAEDKGPTGGSGARVACA